MTDESVDSMEASEAERRAFLRDEYLLLQNQYEDLDRRSLTIKGWVGSGSIAALAIAFDAKASFPAIIPALTAALAVMFWYHEATWKLFQYGFSYRIRLIEAYFRNDPERLDHMPLAPFQVYGAWFKGFVDDPAIFAYEVEQHLRGVPLRRRLFSVAFQPFVCVFYLTIIALSAFSMLLLASK